MITAQDIREKTFEKVRLNGYDMAAVDDFLEELADEITAAQKENAVLKSKMKVLVDKIEEYRANEETLNMAILSAQKLAVQIEGDARTRADKMIADAEAQVQERVGSIEAETKAYERRLNEAQVATGKYFESVRALCLGQLDKLDAISKDIATKAEAPVVRESRVDDAVRSIESTVSRIQPEPSFSFDLGSVDEPVAQKSLENTQPFTV